MIQIIPIKYEAKNSPLSLRTHTLHPQSNITVILTIESKSEQTISILEDHILETISGVDWNSEDIDKDFTFITENYNRFIYHIDADDIKKTSVLLAILKGNLLTLAGIGNTSAHLVEGDEVTEIMIPERGRTDFHTLTTGEINSGSTIYLGSVHLGNIIGNSLLLEFSAMPRGEFEKNSLGILEREITTSLHLIRIAEPEKIPQ